MSNYLTLHFVIYIAIILATIFFIIDSDDPINKTVAFIVLAITCSILYWTYQLILTYGSIISNPLIN